MIYLGGIDVVPHSLNRTWMSYSTSVPARVPQARRPALAQFNQLENRAPVGCRLVPAGADIMDAWGRGSDDARHTQGLTNFPRHIPRLALRAWFSAST